jgi:hypothetical protein
MESKPISVLLPPKVPVRNSDVPITELPLDRLASKYFSGEIGVEVYSSEVNRRAVDFAKDTCRRGCPSLRRATRLSGASESCP